MRFGLLKYLFAGMVNLPGKVRTFIILSLFSSRIGHPNMLPDLLLLVCNGFINYIEGSCMVHI